MSIVITGEDGTGLAQVQSDKMVITSVQDALDLMANCGYQGANRIIVHENNLTPAFFDLKTGVAGEILQKFSNYGVSLAIIGDFAKYPGKSLRDFIYESNKAGRINFVSTLEEAREKLSKR
jgi:glutamate synthase domain-containing protein 3